MDINSVVAFVVGGGLAGLLALWRFRKEYHGDARKEGAKEKSVELTMQEVDAFKAEWPAIRKEIDKKLSSTPNWKDVKEMQKSIDTLHQEVAAYKMSMKNMLHKMEIEQLKGTSEIKDLITRSIQGLNLTLKDLHGNDKKHEQEIEHLKERVIKLEEQR